MQEPNNKASLGCGTLILIALIVMIFGNSNRSGDKQITDSIDSLQSEVTRLKSEIKKQSATLDEIKRSLKELNQRPVQRRPVTIAPDPPTPESPLPEN